METGESGHLKSNGHEKISASTLKGLKSFLRDYPLSMVYGGKRQIHEGNIEIIPVKDALRVLSDILS